MRPGGPRATDTLSPVSPVRTVPAPIRASNSRKMAEIMAKGRNPGNSCRRRTALTSSHIPNNRATPESARCENSIQVASPWSRGRISPWQRGQSRPQPAPDPVALTTAPWSMTITLTDRVVQARAGALIGVELAWVALVLSGKNANRFHDAIGLELGAKLGWVWGDGGRSGGAIAWSGIWMCLSRCGG